MSAAETTAPPLLDRPVDAGLAVEHVFDMGVELEPAQLIPTATGTIMNFVIREGRFEGPKLRGEVVPGGGDGLIAGSDGVGRVDVRATLRTDDAVLIHYTAGGVIRIPPDGLERLDAGERLPFEETYVRTTPRLETTDERYAWLAEHVLIGLNELSKDHIDYRVYRLL
ncbi:MAG: DUF3237 domain-containing protein [Solirubrobacterales bacterium]